jgi:hypothetical protein
MRYDQATDTAVLSASEFERAIAASGLARSALSPRFEGDGTVAAEASVPERGTWMLATCARAFASPLRTAELQLAVADESLRRLTLAWTAERPEDVAVIARRGEELFAGVRSPEEVAAMFLGALGSDGVLTDAGLRAPVASRDAIVLVAVADALRRARLRSELAHAMPPANVSTDEIAAELAGAAVEDFRWLLPLLAKVLPYSLRNLAEDSALTASLGRLAGAKLLAITDASEGAPALVGPAGEGEFLLDGLAHRVSVVAATVAELDGAAVATESMLLVRDASRLWVIDLAGEQGDVSSVGREALVGLASAIAGGPPATQQAPAPAAPSESVEARPAVCASCGKPLVPSAKFCTSCGTPVGGV